MTFAEEDAGVLEAIQELDDRPLAAGPLAQPRDEVRVGQEAHVEDQVGVERQPVLEPEAEERHRQRAGPRRPERAGHEGLAQLVDVHVGRVDDLVGDPPDRRQPGPLLAHALERRSMPGQRMRPARLAVAADQRRLAGFEEDQRRVEAGHRPQRLEHARELLEQRALAHVDHHRGLLDLGVRPQRQLGERRQQRDRQVVDAEVGEVLERAHRLRLAGAGQAGEDDEAMRRRVPAASLRSTGARGAVRARLRLAPWTWTWTTGGPASAARRFRPRRLLRRPPRAHAASSGSSPDAGSSASA